MSGLGIQANYLHTLSSEIFKGVTEKTITPCRTKGSACVGNELSSRSVSRQVLLPLQSLTSVFGMGTGGPSALESPTGVVSVDATLCVGNELSSRLVSKQVLSPL